MRAIAAVVAAAVLLAGCAGDDPNDRPLLTVAELKTSRFFDIPPLSKVSPFAVPGTVLQVWAPLDGVADPIATVLDVFREADRGDLRLFQVSCSAVSVDISGFEWISGRWNDFLLWGDAAEGRVSFQIHAASKNLMGPDLTPMIAAIGPDCRDDVRLVLQALADRAMSTPPGRGR